MNVLAVVGARLNSSRLPGKQLLDLAGQPLVAHIFRRLRAVPEVSHIVLATTGDDFNRPLVHWAEHAGEAVFPFAGDVNDLVGRVDAVVQAHDPDYVLYVCGDSPLIEPSTISAMAKALAAHEEFDIIDLAPPGEGKKYIHEGFNLYRRAVWQRIVAESRSADDKEHLGSALKRFRGEFRVLAIDDNPVFARLEHRLSVDTPSDYRFMREVYTRWYGQHGAESIVSLPWLIGTLERDQELRQINENVRQKAVGEHSRSVLLVCHAGPKVGLGHLMRCLALVKELQDGFFAHVRLLIQGAFKVDERLALLQSTVIADDASLADAIGQEYQTKAFEAVIVDPYAGAVDGALGAQLAQLGRLGVRRVGIDNAWRLDNLAQQLDELYIPAFHVAPEVLARCQGVPTYYGWDYFLLPVAARPAPRVQAQSVRVLVLTGGSDTAGLAARLPQALDQALPDAVQIDWVQGPYAQAPRCAVPARHDWTVRHAPAGLGDLMAQADVALTVYGVSLFELLRLGVPSVVFSPYGPDSQHELQALRCHEVALVADDEAQAVALLAQLCADQGLRQSLAERAAARIDGLGARRVVKQLFKGLGA